MFRNTSPLTLVYALKIISHMKILIENKLYPPEDSPISVSCNDNYNDTVEALFDDKIEWNYMVAQSQSAETSPKN